MIRHTVIAALAVLFICASSGASEVNTGPTFIIKDIEYEYYDNKAEFKIETNEHVNYVVYELEDPYRIIIDPLDTVWCDLEESASFDEGIVKSITFVKARGVPEELAKPYYPFDFIAIELNKPSPYNFSEEGYKVTLGIGEAAQRKTPEKQAPPAQEEPIPPALQQAQSSAPPERLPAKEAKKGRAPSKKEFTDEKKEINIAKNELKKEKESLDKEKLKLAKEKIGLRKDREKLKHDEEELKNTAKIKFKPRPIKDFAERELPSDYLNKALTLDDCIKIAMDNSLAITVAKEKIKVARLKVNEAFRELFPDFTFILDESRGTISDEHYTGRKLGFELKQAIFHGGELMGLWGQSKANLKVAEENLNKAKEEIILNVSKAYHELAKAINKYNLQKELLNDIDADFQIAKKEREFDLIAPIDFMNIESAINSARHAFLTYEDSLSLARLELNKVMNIDMNTELKIAADIQLKEIEIDVNKCAELAAQFKPEYRISYLNKEVAKFTERIANSQTWPQVDIYAKYLKARELLEPTFSLENRLKNENILTGTISLPLGPHTFDYQRKITKLAPTVTTFESNTKSQIHSMRLNLFDNLGRATNIQDAVAGYRQALDDLNKAEQDLHTEIRQAFYSFKESRIKIDNVSSNIELYIKELEIAKIKKGINEATFYELIQAKAKLYNERAAYTDALADYFIAVARINKAIGLGGYFN